MLLGHVCSSDACSQVLDGGYEDKSVLLFSIIHPIHGFKSSDLLKEDHMTWIIFDNVHVWKLIHGRYFLLFP